MLLRVRTLERLHALAKAWGWNPTLLLKGVNETLVASLPSNRNRCTKVLQDLLILAQIDRMPDGSRPIAIWIENAMTLGGDDNSRATLQEALMEANRSAPARGSQAGLDQQPRITEMLPREGGAARLIDTAPFDWSHPDATRLCNLLVSAYPKLSDMTHVARQVPILTNRWDTSGSSEDAWRSLMDVAVAQGKLRAMLDRILVDPLVAAYHGAIRGCAEATIVLSTP
ncbi:MAG: hypothetical protein R3F14_24435 [Polyangiaceae bacterium]